MEPLILTMLGAGVLALGLVVAPPSPFQLSVGNPHTGNWACSPQASSLGLENNVEGVTFTLHTEGPMRLSRKRGLGDGSALLQGPAQCCWEEGLPGNFL